MPTIRLSPLALPATLALTLTYPAPAHATSLVFEPIPTAAAPVDPAYGDRVTSTAQDGWVYRADGGFTPSVVVDYGPLPHAIPSTYRNGFGDLSGVLYERSGSFGYLEVTFTADETWHAQLLSFDMAAWDSTAALTSVSVFDQNGTMLFRQLDVQPPTAGRMTLTFDPPLHAQSLTLAIDGANLGSLSDWYALDNIVFGQRADPLPVQAASWSSLKALYR